MRRTADAHKAANAVERVRVDSVVDLEEDLDARGIVASDGGNESDAESGGRAEVASSRRDADEPGDDARAERDSRPLAGVDAAGRRSEVSNGAAVCTSAKRRRQRGSRDALVEDGPGDATHRGSDGRSHARLNSSKVHAQSRAAVEAEPASRRRYVSLGRSTKLEAF